MSLLSADITKAKRLSLSPPKAVKPASQVGSPLVTPAPASVNLEPLAEAPSQDIDIPKLMALAQRTLRGNNGYTREEVVDLIKQTTKVNQQRAERGFTLMLQAQTIEQAPNPEIYYLAGSTPF
jgi:hypothetical protein